ncbi:kinase-like domain-containing protein [Aspergillus carlsbadensis]|nr:kinase-like domain-containing protein [Aspergillus carlsbadensis]
MPQSTEPTQSPSQSPSQSQSQSQSHPSPPPDKPDNPNGQVDDAPHPLPTQDPYLNLPVIAFGMTGMICLAGESRVVKKPKESQLPDASQREYMNDMNRQLLANEIEAFKRFGRHEGIIECFQLSQYGIELALANGDLEDYINERAEPGNVVKAAWALSLIEAFAHIHSCRVFVDDIALRNILVLDGQVKVTDFGQSILLPLDADITSVTENDLNIRIEILHLGWILYSIASWKVHNYYFSTAEEPDLARPVSFPNVDDVLCGEIIEKCWRGEYACTEDLRLEAFGLLAGQKPGVMDEEKE